jgi:hypothetical protein
MLVSPRGKVKTRALVDTVEQHWQEPAGEIEAIEVSSGEPAGIGDVRGGAQLAAHASRHHVHEDVVKTDTTVLIWDDRVSDRDDLAGLDVQPAFFPNLAAGGLTDGLTEFDHAARDTPFAAARLLGSKDEEHSVAIAYDDPHGGDGARRILSIHGFGETPLVCDLAGRRLTGMA